MHPIWSGVFRPFFILANLWGALVLTIWVLFLTQSPIAIPVTTAWHAHEMLYGYFGGVVIGFLLTAAKNWSNQPPISGLRLKILVGLWVVSRVSFLAQGSLADFFKIFDILTFVLFFGYLFQFLGSKAQVKNWIFLFLVSVFIYSDVIFILSNLKLISPEHYQNAYWVGIQVASLMIILMSDRTMPLFIERALNGEKIQKWSWVEKGALYPAIFLLILQIFNFHGPIFGVICLVVGLFNLIRLWGWRLRKGIFSRLLWIIYIGYFGLILGYLYLGYLELFSLPLLSAIHFFTGGGILLLTYALMSRIALGHTGRPIQISNAILIAYFFLAAGVFIRILGIFIEVSSWVWILSLFGVGSAQIIYLYKYTPYLVAPRVDGKPG